MTLELSIMKPGSTSSARLRPVEPMRVHRGVTLIELMTVMVVVAVLAAIAVPSYRQYIVRTNRTDAKVALTSLSEGLERCFTRFTKYNDANCEADDDLPKKTQNGTYLIQYLAGQPTDRTFELQAVPQDGQVDDARCGTLSINQLNERKATGSQGLECWRR
jgi:type IV pilus assembly protein PilE